MWFRKSFNIVICGLFASYTIVLSANADFVFNAPDQLILNNFNAVGGTTTIMISQVANDWRFELDAGVWNGTDIGGIIAVDPGNPSLLHVNTFAFINPGDQLDVRIVNTSLISLDVEITSPIILPASPINGDLLIDIDGDVSFNDSFDCVDNDLFLNVAGNITQTAAISGSGLGLSVSGSTTLNNSSNDFSTLALSNNDPTSYTDLNDLSIGSVMVPGFTLVGITTAGDDVSLLSSGNLSINNAVNLGGGDLLLDVNGNISQSSSIAGTGLALRVNGTTTLSNPGNDFNTIAMDNGGLSFFTDADGLDVGNVNVNGSGIAGILTSSDDVVLTIGNNCSILNSIVLGAGDLFFNVTGNLSQSSSISGAGLGLKVSGTTSLINGANNFARIAADNQGPTEYRDANDISVGNVMISGNNVTGMTTNGNDVSLIIGGSLSVDNTLNLGTGNLHLDISGNVTQSAGLSGAGLALKVSGNTSLTNTNNNFEKIAGDNGGQTEYTDTDGIEVESVNANGQTITGLSVINGNLTFDAGNIIVNEVILLSASNSIFQLNTASGFDVLTEFTIKASDQFILNITP